MRKKQFKLISWNVNGLRAVLKKGFHETFQNLAADVFMIQESKIQNHQLPEDEISIPGYDAIWSECSTKKGYSGVAAWTRIPPESVTTGIGIGRYDNEGRIIRIDFDSFTLFNVYFPNGQMNEERLAYKLDFYHDFFEACQREREKGRPLVITGDFNTAHNEIDLKNPKANEKRSGFLRVERDWLDKIVAQGYVDTFRYLYPDTVKYSWWSYRFKARERNAGWRLDYFFVTSDIIKNGWLKDAFIDNTVYGSDHCPVGLLLMIS